jgi:hypothetical protein
MVDLPMSDQDWEGSEECDRLVEATGEARVGYFRTLGKVDNDVWLPAVNPRFEGGPAWPTRPAWQRIRTPTQTIIASSGLSDPFWEADGPKLGFGVETALATADELPEDLSPSWLLDLVIRISHHAAADGRFDARYAKYGTFLFSFPEDCEIYPQWVDESNEMGFLVGVPAPGVATTIILPAGIATLLMAKLLTPAEYAFVASHGPDGSAELVDRFARDGTYHLSSLSRKSAI